MISTIEERITTIISDLSPNAYDAAIMKKYMETDSTISMSTLFTLLNNLEDRGIITSRWGKVIEPQSTIHTRLYNLTRPKRINTQGVIDPSLIVDAVEDGIWMHAFTGILDAFFD
jgi:hypothetical protein